VESLLGEAEVSSLQSRVLVPKGHNFGFDRWIALIFLQEFSDVVFLGVDMESLLGQANVSLFRTRVPVLKCHNFGTDSWIAVKIAVR